MEKKQIEFMRLTTDICYIIGGFFGGSLPDDTVLPFMNDKNETVYLDTERNVLVVPDSLTRLQSFALDNLCNDHGLTHELYTEGDFD